jgi:hypothetical protein
MSDEVEQGPAAGSELTYEPAHDEGRHVAEPGAGYAVGQVVPGGHNEHAGTRIAGKNGGTLRPVRSTEAARALAVRRWDKKAEAVRQGMRDAGGLLTEKAGLTLPGGAPIVTEYDVVRVLSTSQVLNAADPSSPGGNQSYQRVLEQAFPKPEREVASAPPSASSSSSLASLDAAALDALLAALRARVAGADGE